MDEDGKTLKEIAEERGIELTEIDLDEAPKLPPKLTRYEKNRIAIRDSGYNVLCAWPGVLVEDDDHEEVQNFFANMGAKHPVHIVGCVLTRPDVEERESENPHTGGRADFLFYFHDDDIRRVAVRRLMHGIRWWEDVVGNELQHAQDDGWAWLNYSIFEPMLHAEISLQHPEFYEGEMSRELDAWLEEFELGGEEE